MSTVLIIGAGGVGRVVAHKCAMNSDVFTRIVLASRTLSKCEQIRDEITAAKLEVAAVDADNVPELVALIRNVQPKLVINVALPYQDLTIMDACLETGVDYLDTANYEPIDEAKFEYKWQWDYQDRFKEKGLMALLGSGFDPGVTNVFCAYAQQYLFDEIHYVDILDANGGDHGYPFATNFNPEINIREVTAKGRYWEEGEWKETEPLSEHFEFNFQQIGPKECYLMYHEELESLAKNIKGLKRIRFYMTFSQNYLTHLRVLENVGMTRIDPVLYNGVEIVPLQFLKAVLPNPGDLGIRTKGKTNIGCIITGIGKDGKPKKIHIYNVCDHEECYREVMSQAISYTTGVPAMIGAMCILKKEWHRPGVWNMEEFDAMPFMNYLNQHGLPWQVEELEV
ncbi:saccharopine dehydrogenase family protein [Chrysiogenes arsenatis]|uniref:saccharopine dehydrogenase family protein n=1 Tax=Chrysiogenes arsenatis TaxID=309797 RepID=UPI00040DA065|nr:saccharopine dehydrogenase family protein [Chrysiogenes arsenatis]